MIIFRWLGRIAFFNCIPSMSKPRQNMSIRIMHFHAGDMHLCIKIILRLLVTH